MLSGGVEVASAYVTLMPSMQGFQGKLDSQLKGITSKAGQESGQTFGQRLGDGVKRWAKRGGVAVGVAAGAAIFGGMNSAMKRQNTERVLEGLYASADIAADMMERIGRVSRKSPIRSAAYMDAAEALAYLGLEGKQAEDILRNMGAAITTAGGDSTQLDQATHALTRMQNAGVVQLDTLNQLSQAGIPIYSGLAEHFGVAQEEIRGLVREGTVGMEDVLAVAENATGEWFEKQVAAAEEVSGTFQNQWRMAQDAITGAIGKHLVPLLEHATPLVSWFGDVAPGMIERLGGAFDVAAGWVGDFVDFLQPGLEAIEGVFNDLGDYVEDVMVPAFSDFIGEIRLGEGVTEGFRSVLDFVVGIFTGLGAVVTETVIPAVQDLVEGFIEGEGAGGRIRNMAETVIDIFMDLWGIFTEYVLPVLSDMWDFITKTLVPDVVGAFVDRIMPVVTEVGETFFSAYHRVILPVLEALWKFIRDTLWPFIVDFYENGIKPTFDLVGKAIEWAWDKVIRPALNAFFDFIADTLWPFIEDFYENGIEPTFRGIGDVIEWVVENVVEPAIDFFGNLITGLKDTFDSAVGGIERAWNTVRSVVAKPIVAVIDFVNDGIISGINTVLDWVGLDGISPIKPPRSLVRAANNSDPQGGYASGWRPGGYADGGILPGYSPGKDDLFFTGKAGSLALAGGEAIMRPEWTRAVGPDFVNEMNAAARAGGVSGVKKALGFADGGIFGGGIGDGEGFVSGLWDFLKGPVRWLRGKIEPFLEALEGNPFYDFASGALSKTVDGIKDKVLSLIGFGGDGNAEVQAAISGEGMPWQAIWGLVKGLYPDAILTSAVRNTRTAGYGTRSLHADGRAIDFVLNPWSRMVDATRTLSQMMGWTELIHTPAGMWQQSFGQRFANFLPITRAQHYDHVHVGMKDGGVFSGLYDDGGLLPPGLSLVANKTGKPEHVLTDEQWDAVIGGGAGGGDTYNLYGVPMDQADDVAGEIMYHTRRVRRGKYARARR